MFSLHWFCSMKPCLGLFFAGLGRHVTLLFYFPLLRMTSWYHLPYYTAHSIFLFLFVDRRFLVRISHNKLTVIINPSNRKLVWTTIVVSLVTCSSYVSFPLTTFTLILALQLNTYTRSIVNIHVGTLPWSPRPSSWSSSSVDMCGCNRTSSSRS